MLVVHMEDMVHLDYPMPIHLYYTVYVCVYNTYVHYEADHHHVAKGVQISVEISPKQFLNRQVLPVHLSASFPNLYGFRVLVEVNRADDEVQEGDDKKSYARIFALDSRSQTVPDEGASTTTRVAPAPLTVTA